MNKPIPNPIDLYEAQDSSGKSKRAPVPAHFSANASHQQRSSNLKPQESFARGAPDEPLQQNNVHPNRFKFGNPPHLGWHHGRNPVAARRRLEVTQTSDVGQSSSRISAQVQTQQESDAPPPKRKERTHRKKNSKSLWSTSPSVGATDMTTVPEPDVKISAPTETKQSINPFRRRTVRWHKTEVEALVAGVRQQGVGRWAAILKASNAFHNVRTSVDLKDKWRNLTSSARIQTIRSVQELNFPLRILGRRHELKQSRNRIAGESSGGASSLDGNAGMSANLPIDATCSDSDGGMLEVEPGLHVADNDNGNSKQPQCIQQDTSCSHDDVLSQPECSSRYTPDLMNCGTSMPGGQAEAAVLDIRKQASEIVHVADVSSSALNTESGEGAYGDVCHQHSTSDGNFEDHSITALNPVSSHEQLEHLSENADMRYLDYMETDTPFQDDAILCSHTEENDEIVSYLCGLENMLGVGRGVSSGHEAIDCEGDIDFCLSEFYMRQDWKFLKPSLGDGDSLIRECDGLGLALPKESISNFPRLG